jgi:hypothetical protein
VTTWLTVMTAVAVIEASASQVRVVRYGDDRLYGITDVDVVVSMAGDAAKCSVERMSLQQSVVDALRASRIKASVSEKASSGPYSVLVSAHSAAVGRSCVTAIGVELIAHVDGIPEADRRLSPEMWGSILVGPLSLVRESALVNSVAANHEIAVLTALRAQVAAIGARITAANR